MVVPTWPGCVSESHTREEALASIPEALDLYLEPVEDDRTFLSQAEILEIAV